MTKRFRRSLLLLIYLLLLAPAVYAQAGDFKRRRASSPLYQVKKWDDKAGRVRIGFIDQTGKQIIGFDRLPEKTTSVGEFHDGRARLEVHDDVRGYPHSKLGFIDETGKVVIAPRFAYAHDFSEGLAYVHGSEWRGFIDRDGKLVIKTTAEIAQNFNEGLAVVCSYEPNSYGQRKRCGYIDRTGREVIKQQYWFADDFSEGLAAVALDKQHGFRQQYGFINRQGEMVIPARFEMPSVWHDVVQTLSVSRFSEGLACVQVDHLYGYINAKGDFVIPPRFSKAQEFSEGLAWVVTGDVKKAGWIDKAGRWVVKGVSGMVFSLELPEFSVYRNFYMDWRYSEGLVFFVVYPEKGTLTGYMDQKGEVIIPAGDFGVASPFTGGIARVEIPETWSPAVKFSAFGYINKQGQFIWRSK